MKKDLLIQKLAKIAETQQLILKKIAEDSDFGYYEVPDPEKAHDDFMFNFPKLLTKVSNLSEDEAQDIAYMYLDWGANEISSINKKILFKKKYENESLPIVMIRLKNDKVEKLHNLAIQAGFKKLVNASKNFDFINKFANENDSFQNHLDQLGIDKSQLSMTKVHNRSTSKLSNISDNITKQFDFLRDLLMSQLDTLDNTEKIQLHIGTLLHNIRLLEDYATSNNNMDFKRERTAY